jgi:hypothetical protein
MAITLLPRFVPTHSIATTAFGTSDEEAPPIVTYDHQAELPSAASGARWGRSFHSLDAVVSLIAIILAAAASALPLEVDPRPNSGATYTVPDDVCWPGRELRCDLSLRLELGETGAVQFAGVHRSSGNRICDMLAKRSARAWQYYPQAQPSIVFAHVTFPLSPLQH